MADQNNNNQNNQDPYLRTLEFLNFALNITEKINQLNLFYDQDKTTIEHNTETTIYREFYDSDFPKEIFSRAPLKSELKIVKHFSNEIDANKIIVEEIYNLNFPEEIIEENQTENDYEILPPVAILKSTNSSVSETVLIAPNMDANWVSVKDFSKYIYYPLKSFQIPVLQHALAYYFIKNYGFREAQCLKTIAASKEQMMSIIDREISDETLKKKLKDNYKLFYEKSTQISDILKGVISSILTVIGESSIDPLNILRYLAGLLNNNEMIEIYTDKQKIYEQVQKNLAEPRIEILTTQASFTTYSVVGEYSMVEEHKFQLTSQGKRCVSSSSTKISRNSIIQIIPLLRSKPVAKNGEIKFTTINEDGIAENEESKEIKLDYETIDLMSINLPTTSWDDITKISSLGKNKIVTEMYNFKFCTEIDFIESLVREFTNISFNYDNITKQSKVRITVRGLQTI